MTIYKFFDPSNGKFWFNLVNEFGELIRTTADKTISNCQNETFLIDWLMVNRSNLANYFGLKHSEISDLLYND